MAPAVQHSGTAGKAHQAFTADRPRRDHDRGFHGRPVTDVVERTQRYEDSKMAVPKHARSAWPRGLFCRRAPRGGRRHRSALHGERSLLSERLSGRGGAGRRPASHVALQPGARAGDQAEQQCVRLHTEQPADAVSAGELCRRGVGRSRNRCDRLHQSAGRIHDRSGVVHGDLHLFGCRHRGHHLYDDQLDHGGYHHHLDRVEWPREEPMMLTTYRTITGESGMSLAEILVASVIIAIGLVGLLSAVPVASYGIHEGRNLSTATFLANQRLEQVRNAVWTVSPANDCLGTSTSSAPTSGACNGAAVTTFPDEASMAAPYGDYTRTVRITDCSVAGCGTIVSADLRQATVTVSYTPMTGAGGVSTGSTKSAIVTMLVAKR